eukprot:GHVN01089997.1.p3 GENE.GHVN01089997.1~~GHVN01089997.1.p3  ORF type:complete len:308 (+),score=64.59 GHVN01089997.1:4181-5104(+)
MSAVKYSFDGSGSGGLEEEVSLRKAELEGDRKKKRKKNIEKVVDSSWDDISPTPPNEPAQRKKKRAKTGSSRDSNKKDSVEEHLKEKPVDSNVTSSSEAEEETLEGIIAAATSLQHLEASLLAAPTCSSLHTHDGEGGQHSQAPSLHDKLFQFKNGSAVNRHVRSMDAESATRLLAGISLGRPSSRPASKSRDKSSAAHQADIGRSVWCRELSWRLASELNRGSCPSACHLTKDECDSDTRVMDSVRSQASGSDVEAGQAEDTREVLRAIHMMVKGRVETNRKLQQLKGKLALLRECSRQPDPALAA